MNIYETGVKTHNGLIRFGIKLSAVPCKHINESSSSTHCWRSSSTHCWRFLDQPIRHQFWKRSLLHQISCYSISALAKKFIHSISYPRKTHGATDSSDEWLLLSVSSMTLVPLSHFTFCVDIRSVQRRKGDLLLSASSTATCSTQLDQNTVTLTTDFHPSNNAHPLISLQSTPGH